MSELLAGTAGASGGPVRPGATGRHEEQCVRVSSAPKPESDALPDQWRQMICSAVTAALGHTQVFVIGSRATCEARPDSDCDVSVVVPSWRLLAAVRRLPAVAGSLTASFGVPVSVNPVPKVIFDRSHHSLYIMKIHVEGVLLGDERSVRSAPESARWDTRSRLARSAKVSYLLSAVHVLLAGIDPAELPRAALSLAANSAVMKARTQAAQACMLATGQYVPGQAALAEARRLGLLPPVPDGIDGFLTLRQWLLRELGQRPVRKSAIRQFGRDLQYAALSALNGRSRWATVLRVRGIEGRLASASLQLLESLSPDHDCGFDPDLLYHACQLLPPRLRPLRPAYTAVRDMILSEWASAQPLVGVIA